MEQGLKERAFRLLGLHGSVSKGKCMYQDSGGCYDCPDIENCDIITHKKVKNENSI